MRAEDNRRFVYFLVFLNILPHWVELPDWVIGFALTFVLWKYMSEHFSIPVPGRFMVHVLGLLCGAGVYLEYGTIMGDEASASILVLTVGLKLFEVRKYRDIMIVTILCYFLLMSKLISSQSLSMTIFMVIDLVLITSLLALHHSPRDKGRLGALTGRSVKLALVSFPIVLLLFFVFPRFSTGIFNPAQKPQATTGFSDELKPGSVAKLLRSNELVFRVKLIGSARLPQSNLYWRGAVLEEGSGLEWKRGKKGAAKSPDASSSLLKSSVVQEIYLEPTSSKFLFGLDWANYIEFPSDFRRKRVREFKGKSFEARVPVKQKEYYLVYSTSSSLGTTWSQQKLEENLQIDWENAPETGAWVEELKSRGVTPAAAINILSQYFQDKKFEYTLEPPVMNNLDDFFFAARRGFCEHYAALTASVLRGLGVPARVVVGFQGGQLSLLGDFIQVRSQDAHAWVEYWNKENKTWKRFDPTAVVSPSRVRSGSDQMLAEFADHSRQTAWDIFAQSLLQRFSGLQLLVDQVDANWTMFLLKYDYSYQKDLLRQLGFQNVSRWKMLGVSVLALIVFVFLIYLFLNRRKAPLGQLDKAFDKLDVKLSKYGLHRERNEGPLAYALRVSESQVEPKAELEEFFATYIELKYRPPGEDLEFQQKELLSAAKKIKVRNSESPQSPQAS